MTENTVEYVKLHLINGLNAEMNGDFKKASQLYSNALNLMESESTKLSGKIAEAKKRQIETLREAIDRTNGKIKENPELKKKEEGINILKTLGIEPLKKSGISLSDIIGLDNVKKEILSRILYPLKFPELSREYNWSAGGGIILYGPPGNGKTHIARALASEVDAYFIYINPSVVYSQWFGSFEKNISSIFKAASMLSPSILFFDEIDAMVPDRDKADSDVVRRGVSQFLNEIGGFTSEKGSGNSIFIMGATNIPWNIDKALMRPGRFDVLIYVPPPDEALRSELFKIKISEIRSTGKVDCEALSKLTDGYSAADIDYICRKASQEAFLEAVSTGYRKKLETQDFINAISFVKPSVTKDSLELYQKFSRGKS
ncbi:MAG: ATP-binding protein [Thermoplasmataceae archaeon]